LTPSRSICGIAFPKTGFVALYSSAIHLPKGIAQPRSEDRHCGAAWAKISRQFYDKIVAAPHNRSIRNFILRDQFQIALPPEKKAIILAHKVGIGPVGVRP
jgi:hypothetical protein